MNFEQTNNNQGDVNNVLMDIPLEVESKDCDGRGRDDNYTSCYPCGGTGSIVTEFGEKVLEFVKKYIHFRIK